MAIMQLLISFAQYKRVNKSRTIMSWWDRYVCFAMLNSELYDAFIMGVGKYMFCITFYN